METLTSNILSHLKEHWEHHLAAGTGSVVSISLTGFSIGGLIQAICTGYCLYLLTTSSKLLFQKVFGKK